MKNDDNYNPWPAMFLLAVLMLCVTAVALAVIWKWG